MALSQGVALGWPVVPHTGRTGSCCTSKCEEKREITPQSRITKCVVRPVACSLELSTDGLPPLAGRLRRSVPRYGRTHHGVSKKNAAVNRLGSMTLKTTTVVRLSGFISALRTARGERPSAGGRDRPHGCWQLLLAAQVRKPGSRRSSLISPYGNAARANSSKAGLCSAKKPCHRDLSQISR